VSEFTRTVSALHYYDSVLVIEKKAMEEPQDLFSGIAQVEVPEETFFQMLKRMFLANI